MAWTLTGYLPEHYEGDLLAAAAVTTQPSDGGDLTIVENTHSTRRSRKSHGIVRAFVSDLKSSVTAAEVASLPRFPDLAIHPDIAAPAPYKHLQLFNPLNMPDLYFSAVRNELVPGHISLTWGDAIGDGFELLNIPVTKLCCAKRRGSNGSYGGSRSVGWLCFPRLLLLEDFGDTPGVLPAHGCRDPYGGASHFCMSHCQLVLFAKERLGMPSLAATMYEVTYARGRMLSLVSFAAAFSVCYGGCARTWPHERRATGLTDGMLGCSSSYA